MSIFHFSVTIVQYLIQTHISQPSPSQLCRVDLALLLHRPSPKSGLRSRCRAYEHRDKEQLQSHHRRVGRREQSLWLRHEVMLEDGQVGVELSGPNRRHSDADVPSTNTQVRLAAVSE